MKSKHKIWMYMSAVLNLFANITMGQSQDVIITPREFNITSPSFPNNYPANLSEVIRREHFYHLMVINITVKELIMEESEGCKFDALFIEDNNGKSYPGGPFCGNASKYTRSNLSWSLIDYGYTVRFKSDSTDEYKGFSLKVQTSSVTSEKVCNSMHKKEEQLLESSIIQGGKMYPTNVNCSWDIAALDGQQITLVLSKFDIEFSGRECVFDRFEVWDMSRTTISDGTLLGKYCGRFLFRMKFPTNSRHIRLKFISDEVYQFGGFLIHYTYTNDSSISAQVSGNLEYRDVAATWQAGYLSGLGEDSNFLTTWTFRAQPGYDVIFNMNETAMDSAVIYNGPDSSCPKISLNKSEPSVETRWFHVIIETSEPVVLSFFANKSRVDNFTGILRSVLADIADDPNRNNCAYAGVAVYDPDIAFDALKGVLCEVQPNYLDIVKYLKSGSKLLLYLYRQDNPKYYVLHYKQEKCQTLFIRSDILSNNYNLSHNNFKFAVSKINNHEAKVEIDRRGPSTHCLYLHIMPYSMVNKITDVSSDLNVDISLTFYFNISSKFELCTYWAYLPRNESSELLGSKYIKDNCKSQDQEEGITSQLQIRSGWSLQYFRIRLDSDTTGKVKTSKACRTVLADSESRNLISDLRCGQFWSFYRSHSIWTLVFPKNLKLYKLYFWKLELWGFKQVLVAEKDRELVSPVFTELDLSHLEHRYRPFSYSSMTNIELSLAFLAYSAIFVKFNSSLLDNVASDRDSNNCSDDSVYYEHHCYTFKTILQPTSWHSAQKDCIKGGGYLVSVNSEAELTFLQQALAGVWFRDFYGKSRGLIYIGLDNLHQGKEFYWADGRPLTFRDWYHPYDKLHNVLPFQPDPPLNSDVIQPAANVSERCVAMVPGNLGFSTNWRTVRCDDSIYSAPIYSICEYSISMEYINNKSTPHPPTSLRCNNSWTLVDNDCYVILKLGYPISETNESLCLENGGDFPADSNMETLVKFLSATDLRHSLLKFPISRGNVSVSGPIQWMCYSFNGQTPEIDVCNDERREEYNDSIPWHHVQVAVICESPAMDVNENCEPYHFQCRDGTCLNPDRLCDNTPDCKDQEDETNCNGTILYLCDNGKKISVFNYCDFHDDCLDKSDEWNCNHPNCSADQYRCRNGECVSATQRCDVKADCVDESDEIDCDFDLDCNGFQCPSGVCIPKLLRNDLVSDCPGNNETDEKFEKDKLMDHICTDPGELRCELGHSRCYPGNQLCVYDHDIYGYLKHCRNAAHLKNCEDISCQNMFKCPKSYCIPYHKVCDGEPDCLDGTDESNCNDNPCSGRLKCRSSNVCVSLTEVCDGQVHCKDDWSDEQFCDLKNAVCPKHCTCLGYKIICNNRQLQTPPDISMKINVRVLHLDNNSISLSHDTFRGWHYLADLSLSHNSIGSLAVDSFVHNPNLIFLDLSFNNIKVIPRNVFSLLKQLQYLGLQGNPIEEITQGSFTGLSSLGTLDLSDMYIEKIGHHTFCGLNSVKTLILNNSRIQQIYIESFDNARGLEFLSLEQNPLEHTGLEIIKNLPSQEVRLPEKFCCFSHKFTKAAYCSPTPSVFICSDLLPNISLKGFAWGMAIFAILGNISVIGWRLRLKLPDVPSIFILNLSISDLLMAIYLLILAIADATFSDTYPLYDKSWRESIMCKIIGVLGFLSCEMSTFMLLLIAIDRTKKLGFPFSSFQFTRQSALSITLLGWSVCISLSLLPLLFTSYFGDYYSKNSICMPFNFAEQNEAGWEFTTAVFVGFNSFTITTIIVLYVLLYFKLKQSRMKAGRRDFLETQVARKLSVVVITDLVCMTPIILTNTIVLFGFHINKHLAAIIASVILPINSLLNPYLFSLKNYLQNYRRNKRELTPRTSATSVK